MNEDTSTKFIVPRQQWRGCRTFHYCRKCEHVIGAPKNELPICPVCKASDPDDIFSIIDRKLPTLWRFVEEMRVKAGPYGRYKGYAGDPRPYRIVAADQAISLNHIMHNAGYTPPWTKNQLEAWIDTILLDLNPATGLIEDPFEIEARGRTDEVLFQQYCVSRGLASVFAKAGFPHKYQLPQQAQEERDCLADEQQALAFLNDQENPADFLDAYTWETSPYSKGSQVTWAIRRHEALQRKKGLTDDGVVEFVHQWLDRKQNPNTGYWGGEKASLNNRMCGAFKLLVAYEDHHWKLNYLDKMVDTTISISTPPGDFGDNGFGCTVFDALLVFKIAQQQIPDYRAEDIYETTARTFLNFINHWSDEEHFFTPQPMPGARAEMVAMHGLATPMYMAEVLLGVEMFP